MKLKSFCIRGGRQHMKKVEISRPKDMRTYNVWWKFTRPFTSTVSNEVLKSSKMQFNMKLSELKYEKNQDQKTP